MSENERGGFLGFGFDWIWIIVIIIVILLIFPGIFGNNNCGCGPNGPYKD